MSDMKDFTYPASERVVLAHSPGRGGPFPFIMPDSSTYKRLSALYGDWVDQAVGVNARWNANDYVLDRPHQLEKILAETQCRRIVATHVHVYRILGLDRASTGPLEELTVELDGREIEVLRFPNPTDRNRYWRIARNRVEASDSLRRFLLG